MKYYSEKLNRLYDSQAECEKAEFEAKEAENREKILAERKAAEAKAQKEKEAAERKMMATEVDEAYKAMVAAQNAYKTKLEAFVKKYGSYHTSLTTKDIPSLFDIFNPFLLNL